MPSNKEIISKAIEKTIQSNEAIDLLMDRTKPNKIGLIQDIK